MAAANGTPTPAAVKVPSHNLGPPTGHAALRRDPSFHTTTPPVLALDRGPSPLTPIDSSFAIASLRLSCRAGWDRRPAGLIGPGPAGRRSHPALQLSRN